jgi:hypothetical protein
MTIRGKYMNSDDYMYKKRDELRKRKDVNFLAGNCFSGKQYERDVV